MRSPYWELTAKLAREASRAVGLQCQRLHPIVVLGRPPEQRERGHDRATLNVLKMASASIFKEQRWPSPATHGASLPCSAAQLSGRCLAVIR